MKECSRHQTWTFLHYLYIQTPPPPGRGTPLSAFFPLKGFPFFSRPEVCGIVRTVHQNNCTGLYKQNKIISLTERFRL